MVMMFPLLHLERCINENVNDYAESYMNLNLSLAENVKIYEISSRNDLEKNKRGINYILQMIHNS